MSQPTDTVHDTRAAPAARSNAIVHLGLIKTGTTSIQNWLSVNSCRLPEQGFYYDGFDDLIRTGCSQTGVLAILAYTPLDVLVPAGQLRHRLGITTVEDQRPVAVRIEKAFRESVEKAGDQTVILSSEMVGNWARKPEHVAGICEMFRQYFDKVTYVVYMREQAEWLLSAYSQAAKTGALRSLEDFAKLRGVNDYFHLAEMWAAHAGRENVVFRLFDREFLEGGDAVADFAKVCGIDTGPMITPLRANESVSKRELEIFHQINSLEKRFGLDPTRRTRWKRKLARRFRNDERITMDTDLIRHVRALNAESNERFRAKYFPDRPVLFSALRDTTDAPTQTRDAPATPSPQQN